MSVIHDVLKDLHDRHRQQQLDECLPFMKDNVAEPNKRKWLLYSTWIVTFACLYLVVNLSVLREPLHDPLNGFLSMVNPITRDASDHEVVPGLKPEIKFSQNPHENNLMGEDAILSKTLEQSDQINPVPLEYLDSKKTVIKEAEIIHQEIENTTTVRNEKSLSQAINEDSIKEQASDIKRAKASPIVKYKSQENMRAVAVSTQSILDEGRIKLWMKDEPKKVWPYIKNHVPDFMNHTHLIALSAQAEQRSEHHEQAMYLYNVLINREPRQGRWKIGMAISLDAQGNQGSAKTYYQQGLSDQSLPAALKQFTYQRLQLLEAGGKNDR